MALGAAFFSGLNNFLKVLSAHHNHDASKVALYFNVFSTIFAGIFLIFFFQKVEWNLLFFAIVFIIAVFNVLNIKYKVLSLKILDSSEYFIFVRSFIFIFLLFFGIVLFQEKLSVAEIIGIGLNFLAIFFLFDLQGKFFLNRPYFWKGILFAVITGISMTAIGLAKKYIIIFDYDKFAFLFFVFLFSIFISLVFKHRSNENRNIFPAQYKKIAIICAQAGSNFLAQVCSFFALISGKIVIVNRITSFSLFVVIFLSVIFLGEKITVRKIWAFVFTVVSLLLFNLGA